MSDNSSMVLLGIGTAGAHIVRGVSRAYGDGLRYMMADTDASTGNDEEVFTLLGGDRLSGRGAGGDVVAARFAAEDSMQQLDARLEGARMVVVVACLGGGTGGGSTLEIVTHLSSIGVPCVVFATLPFTFEGPNRQANAHGVMPLIDEVANASFFVPLDRLVQGEDNMEAALSRAVDTMAGGVTLFWRLVERSGYIRLDADRLRRIVCDAGRGRFAVASAQGPDRAAQVVDSLLSSELLSIATIPANAIVCGILGGEDLRLSEIATIADGIRNSFGGNVNFDLGTVNDEATFSGRIAVVVMLFETPQKERGKSSEGSHGGRSKRWRSKSVLVSGSSGRFNKAEPTIWHDEDVDVPTFVRRGVDLDI